MQVTNAPLDGLKVIDPDKFDDSRGYFLKSFEKKAFSEQGIDFDITQVNHSFNHAKGTLRGMHLQVEPFAQTKLVFCIKGKVFDVAIDLRKDSPTYKEWYGLELSEENKKILYIPKGFAHGYLTLTDNAEVLYYLQGEYSKEYEVGFKWDDPAFTIEWPIEPTVIADKDNQWSSFSK